MVDHSLDASYYASASKKSRFEREGDEDDFSDDFGEQQPTQRRMEGLSKNNILSDRNQRKRKTRDRSYDFSDKDLKKLGINIEDLGKYRNDDDDDNADNFDG